ncbi:hypothetical protein RMSM_03618 [Rhodopirellula maiorica SM1]|uniref:Uncharacterized protein n=1 Tax=Rhodopirellula maiorica SM1 TaxID=1265738 RepID=M5RJF7_9BACT|nr:hypothetical protein RMSM_03618 [Rhodopirellula maiorica SM1]
MVLAIQPLWMRFALHTPALSTLMRRIVRGASGGQHGFYASPFGITFALWQRTFALVQSLLIQSQPLRSRR